MAAYSLRLRHGIRAVYPYQLVTDPMDRFEDYNDVADRLADHARDGTTDSAPGLMRMPASYYLDPALWKVEVERIFKRLPLLLAFTGELRQPGRYKAMKVVGMPVVM